MNDARIIDKILDANLKDNVVPEYGVTKAVVRVVVARTLDEASREAEASPELLRDVQNLIWRRLPAWVRLVLRYVKLEDLARDVVRVLARHINPYNPDLNVDAAGALTDPMDGRDPYAGVKP